MNTNSEFYGRAALLTALVALVLVGTPHVASAEDSRVKQIEAPESLEAAMAHLEKVFGRFTQDDNRQFRFVFDNDEATLERGEDETMLIVKNGVKTYGVPIRTGKQIEIDVIETIQRKIYDVGPQGERTLSRRVENHMTRRYLLQRELTGDWTFAVISVSHSIPYFRNRPMRTGRVNWIKNGVEFVGFGTDYFFRKGGGLELGANLARYTLLRDGNRLVQKIQSQSYELATGPDGETLPMPDFDRPFGDLFKKEDVSEAIVEE